MTLEKQIIGIPLRGLNNHADSKSAEAGDLFTATNVTFKRTARGGAELRKRSGGAALNKTAATSVDAAVTSGFKLATFENERMMLDADTLRSYSPQQTGWSAKGRVSNVGVTLEHVSEASIQGQLTGGSGCVAPDVAISGNLMLETWLDTSTAHAAYYAVFDRNTGDRLTSDTVLATGMTTAGWVRVIALSTKFILICAKGSTGQVVACTVDYATPSVLGGPTVITADLNASCKGDVIRNGVVDEVLVAYHTTAPALRVIAVTAARTLNGSNSSAQTPDQCIGWLHWDYSDGTADVSFISAAGGLRRITVTLATLGFSATAVDDAASVAGAQITGYRAAAARTIYFEVRASPTYNTLTKWWNSTVGGAAAVLIRSVGISSRVFKVGTKYYLTFAYESPLQNTYFVTEIAVASVPVVVARALYGFGGGLSTVANIGLPQVMANGTTALVPVMRLSSKLGATPFYGACVANVDFSGTGLSGPKRVGDNLHVPGGVVRAYAGEGPATNFLGELGFFLFPETPTLTQNAAAGALTLLGTYQYVAVYSFTDAKGQIHRSAPSDIATITLTGANQVVQVTVPTLRISTKSGLLGTTGQVTATIEVYGTQSGGTTFYRLPSQLASDPNVDTGAVNDTISDATKGTGEVLYTSGKVLPHIAPPAAKLMESWRNRLFLAGTENPLELWPSNEYAPGEGVSFSDALVITMESDGGPITALAEMDDRLLIFKRNAIYALGGNGPTLTGGDPYEQPSRVCSHVGAIGQAGVVKTRDGVMFVSPRGIYMYTRGGEAVFIGAGVEGSSASVTGACVVEDAEQVRFVQSTGQTLVYHYGLPDEQGIGRWTLFTGQSAVDCIMWNGVYVYLQTDGTVVEETPGVYVDPGAAQFSVVVRTTWLSLTQFFGRLKLYTVHYNLDVLATFTLSYRLYLDYNASAQAELGTLAVTVATLPPIEVTPARRRVSAVQLYLEENSTTAGFRLSSFGLEVGVEPGAKKQGTEKFFG
jgi:hypothetical protein